MKPYLQVVLKEILKNKKLYYVIECEGIIDDEPTRHITLATTTKDKPYQGVNAFDSCSIQIVEKTDNPEDEWEYIDDEGEWQTFKGFVDYSFIYWINWNDNIERISDHGMKIDKSISKVSDKWLEEYNNL